MADFESEFRIVDITGVEEYRNQPILTADARPDDEFDRIIIFKRNEFDELFGSDRIEPANRAIFVRLDDIFDDGVVRAYAHKYNLFGSIPADADHHTKVVNANFTQGSAQAEVSGEKCALTETALVTGKGTVKLEFDRNRDTYNALIQEYTTPPPTEADVVEATVAKPGKRDKAIVLTEDGRYSVILDESVPFPGDITVEITDGSHPIQAKLAGYIGSLPAVGDKIETTLQQQTKSPTVSSGDVTFDVSLSEPPLMTGEATIELTEIGQPVRGEIIDYADSPAVGDVLKIDATKGETPNRVSPEGEQYEIVLDKPLIMDGDVEIEITTVGNPFQGTPRSYCGRLPAVGQEFRATVTELRRETFAEPDLHSFKIHIEDDTTYRGPAKVEITSASLNGITGRIVDEIQTKSQTHSTSNNPFR
jgi:hypothetical protein